MRKLSTLIFLLLQVPNVQTTRGNVIFECPLSISAWDVATHDKVKDKGKKNN